MAILTSRFSDYSFDSISSGIASCKTCGEPIEQPAAFVEEPFYCSKQCEVIISVPLPPATSLKSASTLNILHSGIEVFAGYRSPAFKREFETRLGFIQAWAKAEQGLSIYTMDTAPWKNMIDHELVTSWPNPRDYHTYALETAYNMAHHDECEGLYMEACTSLLGAIIRVFLMWDLTQLGVACSKLSGICLDQDRNTLLRGEDVITVPDELMDGELLQIAWTWPAAMEAAKLTAPSETTTSETNAGTFDFDRSHWETVIEVIRKVSGSVWED